MDDQQECGDQPLTEKLDPTLHESVLKPFMSTSGLLLVSLVWDLRLLQHSFGCMIGDTTGAGGNVGNQNINGLPACLESPAFLDDCS